jgi:4-carboxymuconolactone decarboxylase
MSQEQYEAGLRERKAVLGAEYVEKALAAADSFNRDFQNMVTEYCWGGTWGRGVLTRKERSLINLVMLSALNRPHEFKIHMRGALTNGLTLDQIKEALHIVAVYCGIPAGVEAFRLAREVLEENGIKPPK